VFRGIGRRLALFNAIVVIALIALTGAAIYLLLLHQLSAEMDNELRSSARQTANYVRTTQPSTTTDTHDPAEDEDDDEHKRHDDAILGSGDTIVFAVNSGGEITYNPRGVTVPSIPNAASIERALDGKDDIRSLTLAGIGPVRVASLPMENDHQVVGAVQVFRSLREHNAELATVRWITVLGVALGAAIAVPAGLFLAQRAMRPIDAAFARQRAFVADASHELRTPLTLIRANAEIAREETTEPVSSIEPELTSILEEVDRTDRLIDDLLILARADAGRLELHREMLDLATLAREVYTDMLPMAHQFGIDLRIDASAPCLTLIDVDRFRQALRIVLDNAVKYTPAGHGVTLTVTHDADHLRVVVQDTGEGIPPEHLPHLFDRFYRVDQSRSRAAGGTGLGLPIARALVEAQGGSIDLTSIVGQGTTVTINFPRQGNPALTRSAPHTPRS
jgi:signal transduction histidine kinase